MSDEAIPSPNESPERGAGGAAVGREQHDADGGRAADSPFPRIDRHGDAVLPVTGWLLRPLLHRRGNGDPVCTFNLVAGAGEDVAVIPCVVEGRIAEELAEAGGMREGVRVDVHGRGRIAHVDLGDLPPHHVYTAVALDTCEVLGRTAVPPGPYASVPSGGASLEHSAAVDAWLREARAELAGGPSPIAVRSGVFAASGVLLDAPSVDEDWRGHPYWVFSLVSGGAAATGLVPCVVVVEALADSLYDYGLDAAVRTQMRVTGRRVDLQGEDAPPHVPEMLVVESLDYLNEGDDVLWRAPVVNGERR